MSCLVKNLNEEQKKAVESSSKAILVLAGAGTGKTKVLITKIAYILENKFALPYQILALTFTNKAADEMKNRLSKHCDTLGLWVGTFHSICLKILRIHYDKVDLRKDFIIFGEEDQKSIIKNIVKKIDLEDIENPIDKISFIKDTGKAINDSRLRLLYDLYNEELKKLNAIDFGDIILKVIELFTNNPSVKEKYQNQFKYILVDEFQDTSNIQHKFLKLIYNDNTNIFCVGDEDQSIYSWRGAEIKHILNFTNDYKNSSVIKLEVNYRSTSNILNVANSIIINNKSRFGKELKSFNNYEGEKVKIREFSNDLSEAQFISKTILNLEENYLNCAILIRNGNLSRLFEEEFINKGIPYKIIGTTRFYDRQEIKDIICYIRLLVHPFDDIAFLRIIGKPKRGMGEVFINKLYSEKTNLFEALHKAKLSNKQRIAADEFINIFNINWQNLSPVDAVNELINRSGYLKDYLPKLSESKERLLNIKDLVNDVISKYDNLSDFLEHASLMNTQDDDKYNQNAVKIMTVHAAKGLEFDTVFIPAFEEDIFPNSKSDIEEERRLAYVACTRAKKRLIITHSKSRQIFGEIKAKNPSVFIDEIDKEYLDLGVLKSNIGTLVFHEDLGKGVIIKENNNIATVVFMNKKIKQVNINYLKFI